MGCPFPLCACGEVAPHPTLLTQGHLPPQRALRVGGKGKALWGFGVRVRLDTVTQTTSTELQP
jgi:hypothetical protein